MIEYILLIIASYLIGAIPFSLIFAKIFKNVDVRQAGSGNVGATNTLVSAGKRAAALALLFDVAKGFSAVVMARIFIGTDAAVVIAAVVAILGHDFPVYLQFSGGKGISTTVGALIAINPYIIFIILILYLFFVLVTRYLILSSLLVLAVLPAVFYFLGDGVPYVVFTLLALLIALYAHREDIIKLVSGREGKITSALTHVV
ncbi:MAG: glycerol-3-phosphate 1-O-acyltransferase PlsY [Candidatus Margulisiibacteriota bacterium]